jgi:glycosyltransferase involved in cell wall biosynthesis
MIVQPNSSSPSETFIRMHNERLPADITVVHSALPRVGERLVLNPSIGTAVLLAKCWLLGHQPEGKWVDWATSCGYARGIERFRPDAVLAEYGPIAVRVSWACRRYHVPLIAHFHGHDASHRATLEQYRAAYQQLFASASATVAVSRSMESRLLALGAPRDRLHYNPYGVDTAYFQGANPRTAPSTFLTVGRFVEKKAPHLTLLAFSRAHAECPDMKLRMIGDGPLLGVCRDLARQLELDNAVTFLGCQPPDLVCMEMRKARGFVQHSVEASDGDCEGTPVAILEAGSCGLPVVSTRHAGISDVVIPGETGLLSAERDVTGMAENLIRLCRDPETASMMGSNARKHICANHALELSLSRLMEIIRQAVAAKPT